MTTDPFEMPVLLKAVNFSAFKHRTQRRKDKEATPYINHPIAVAHVLAGEGGVTDLTTLVAAILHDTLEDTETTSSELEAEFGPEVRALVEEVTDDKLLPKLERKQLQIDNAPAASIRAKQIKLADKISNIRDVVRNPPTHWDMDRRVEYLNWSERVIAGCRGSNEWLEQLYDVELRAGREALAEEQRRGK